MLARSALRPRKRNAGRPAEKSAPGFLQWLRGRPCVDDNQDCAGKMEAAKTMHRKNLLALANEYWMAWPGRIAWLRKLADG